MGYLLVESCMGTHDDYQDHLNVINTLINSLPPCSHGQSSSTGRVSLQSLWVYLPPYLSQQQIQNQNQYPS